jgi:hypothetical protein
MSEFKSMDDLYKIFRGFWQELYKKLEFSNSKVTKLLPILKPAYEMYPEYEEARHLLVRRLRQEVQGFKTPRNEEELCQENM